MKTVNLDIDNAAVVLKVLRDASTPITLAELSKRSEINEDNCNLALDGLSHAGYDIKKISIGKKTHISLVRSGPESSDIYYRILGDLTTPAAFLSDWHIGSKGFSRLAFKEFLKSLEKYQVKSIVIPGDLFQGKGVYKIEAADLLYPDIDAQVELGVELFEMIPKDIKIHAVIGNHENYLKSSYEVGYDMLKNVATQCQNMIYYGHAAKLSINKNHKLTAMIIHGGGSPAYAISYKPQKMWDSLLERPTVFAFGHLHQLEVLPRPKGNYILQCGTLQRESSYLINKGITPELGWIIMKNISEIEGEFIIVRPKLY